MDTLTNVSLIDRLYSDYLGDIKGYFSEFSIIRYKLLLMIEYIISLSKLELFELTNEEIEYMKGIYKNINIEECKAFKNLLDINTYEEFLKKKINLNKSLEDKGVSIFINFSLIDDDIYNLVNIIIIKNVNMKILLPKLSNLLNNIKKKILEWSKIAILTRINHKINTPSFLGKELLVFYERLVIQSRKLNLIKYTCKFGGSNGNFNSLHLSLPNIDWIDFGDKFITLLGMERNQYTTRYDHLDNYSEIFHIIVRVNNILLDMNNYLRQNIELDYIKLDKINLININEIESLLLISNNSLNFLADILPKKHYLNNLLLGNLGEIYSNCIISIEKLNDILNNIKINKKNIDLDLENNSNLILEGIESRLKILGVENSKEILEGIENKNDKKSINNFISGIDIDMRERKYLNTISPFNYTGLYKL